VASIGSFMARVLHLSASNINLIILCGTAGLLTGVTRTPFTSAILVLEMTNRDKVIFHVMSACMVAGIVATIVDKHFFYDHIKHQYIHELMKENDVPPHRTGPSTEEEMPAAVN